MGGRGAYSSSYTSVPNPSKAKIRGSKLTNYLLNPTKEPDKANLFKSLGYSMKNADRLKSDMIEGLKNNKAKKTNDKSVKNRTYYQVDMELGITDKQIIRTGWKREGKGRLEFVTAYPKRKKRDG